jgi:transcriptional regulator with XRE-family HTH domain
MSKKLTEKQINNMVKFGIELKDIIENIPITQKELSNRIKCDAGLVSKWINGTSPISAIHLSQVCEVLDLDESLCEFLYSMTDYMYIKSKRNDYIEYKIEYTRNQLMNRNEMIKKMKDFWIEGILNESLKYKKAINFDYINDNSLIINPLSTLIKSKNAPSSLHYFQDIFNLFNEYGREILIVGDAGCGKTTIALQLVKGLLEDAAENVNVPVPVVFVPSSWDTDKISLKKWLQNELNSKYHIREDIAEYFIDNQIVMPIIDGIDEIPEKKRKNAITLINDFCKNHISGIMICCRQKEYSALNAKLHVRNAIFIKKLTNEKVNSYLDEIGNLDSLKYIINKNWKINNLAKHPLTLNIIIEIYRESGIDDNILILSEDEMKKAIFDKYIEDMFNRGNPNPKFDLLHTKYYLNRLAQMMKSENKTIFLVEYMQPEILTDLWRFIWASTGGLLWIYILWYTLNGYNFSLLAGFGGWLAVTIFQYSLSEIKINERFSYSLLDLFAMLFPGPQEYFRLLEKSTGKKIVFKSQMIITNVSKFNSGIWKSIKNACIYSMSAISPGMIYFYIFDDAVVSIKFMGFFIVQFWLGMGGLAFIQHFTLRAILIKHSVIPLHMHIFLDHCVSRLLLRRVGNGYMFFHRTLLDHFEALEVKMT